MNAFRERAKTDEGQIRPCIASMPRSITWKNSPQKHQPVADLRRYLDEQSEPTAISSRGQTSADPDPIPAPPAFYAEPPYIGSHKFVGRQAQLDVLSDWAVPADPHPVLLFDAIGGSGKSMLTWEWTTNTPPRSVGTGPAASGIPSTSGGPSWPTSAGAPSPISRPAAR